LTYFLESLQISTKNIIIFNINSITFKPAHPSIVKNAIETYIFYYPYYVTE